MTRTRRAHRRWRPVLLGPVVAVTVLAAGALVTLAAGWLLPWLLLGLAAGYALSGSV